MAIALILFCVFQVMPAVSNAAPALSSLPPLTATTTFMPVSTNMADEEAKHGKRSLNRLPFEPKYIGTGRSTLEIYPNGTVRGVRVLKPEYGVLRLLTACLATVTSSPSLTDDNKKLYGRVSIKGVKSGLHLCMNSTGHIYGSKFCTKDCTFRQEPSGDHTIYSSLVHKGPPPNRKNPLSGEKRKRKRKRRKKKKWLLGIQKNGEMIIGWKGKANRKNTHFIERPEKDPHGYHDPRYPSSVSTTLPSQKDNRDKNGGISVEESDEHRINEGIYETPDTPPTSQTTPKMKGKKKRRRNKKIDRRNCDDNYPYFDLFKNCNKSKRKQSERKKTGGPFSGSTGRRRHKKVSTNPEQRRTSNPFSFPMR